MKGLKESFSEVMSGIEERMANFEIELQKTAKNPGNSPNLSTLTTDFMSFKTFVMETITAFRVQIEYLTREVDNIEMRSRRKMLLVHGIPDDKAEDTPQTLVNVIKDKLKIIDFKTMDIRRCHRMGRATNTDKPRPILVKFQSVTIRDKIWFTKTKLKGSGVTLSEFVTRVRHELFMAAREKCGISKCWTREGRVYFLGADGTRHRVDSLSELSQLVPDKAAEIPADKPTIKTRRAASKK